jgi:hypothetical protein
MIILTCQEKRIVVFCTRRSDLQFEILKYIETFEEEKRPTMKDIKEFLGSFNPKIEWHEIEELTVGGNPEPNRFIYSSANDFFIP